MYSTCAIQLFLNVFLYKTFFLFVKLVKVVNICQNLLSCICFYSYIINVHFIIIIIILLYYHLYWLQIRHYTDVFYNFLKSTSVNYKTKMYVSIYPNYVNFININQFFMKKKKWSFKK